ncbi:MAG: EFR1 family ferrodoxin [Oscillospiraceae bacterium]|jgi:formate hydrogenlyase subunit 6/NADH:ubiquinone oxidoreductase subunit I|nr:EFR1 family ferrodoxin [Oscillospiraceae bacterium]
MNVIYWFSGTGNSFYAAKKIAERLEDCDLLPISKLAQLPPDCERVGFVFPHYALGVPNLVREKLEDIDLSGNQSAYFFAVETCGAFPGSCLGQVNTLLKKQGAVLSYGTVIRMFANNVVNYDMKGDPAEKAAAAEPAIQAAAVAIQQKQAIKIPHTQLLYQLPYRAITATYPKKGLQFHADENCTGCGMCAKLCPAGNITMQNGRPMFGASCEQCVACIQWCPRRAIQFGNKTQARTRYHHPAIQAGELFRAAAPPAKKSLHSPQ